MRVVLTPCEILSFSYTLFAAFLHMYFLRVLAGRSPAERAARAG
jgi:hypothetical protein